MKYFAYGSNLNIEQMEWRCPDAIPLKPLALDNRELSFNYFADIVPANNIVHGALWDITKECEVTLDRYEGVKKHLYSKKYFWYGDEKVLYYKMNMELLERPSRDYVLTIKKGYEDFGLPLKFLWEAVSKSLKGL